MAAGVQSQQKIGLSWCQVQEVQSPWVVHQGWGARLWRETDNMNNK